MHIEQKEITVLKGQLSKIENRANEITIENADDYGNAADLLSQLKTIASTIKDKKEAITRPLNEALRSARDLFAPVEKQYADAEAIIKGKLLDYKKKSDAEARAEEERLVKQLDSGRMKLETAEKKMEAIERVETTTRGKIGEVQVRKVKKVRILDEGILPRKYLVPDHVAIRRDALNGIMIPGTEVYEEESIAAGRF